jgi:LDH2 family malate/lactate/ureidoglycolate dehydrogenase
MDFTGFSIARLAVEAQARAPPLMFEFATSVVARGGIELHRRAGNSMPPPDNRSATGSRPLHPQGRVSLPPTE